MPQPAVRAQCTASARPCAKHPALFRSRAGTAKASSSLQASKRNALGFLVEIEGVLCETTPITACVAWATAQSLWPEIICGTPQLYTRYLRQILPAVSGLSEAVLLIRILVEEGVIGARSTAGREGPVVGRPVRLYGSRPLLPTEITEHWDMVKDAAMLRWQAVHADTLEEEVRDSLKATMQAVSPQVLSSADLVEAQPAVVESVRGSCHDVHLVSSYSAATADLLTDKLDLQHFPVACTTEHQEVVQHVAQVLQQYETLHVIVSNVPLAAALADKCMAADQAVHVWVAEWALPTAGLQAKVKRLPNVQLLSETKLADIMGVTHLRVVMDGISWE